MTRLAWHFLDADGALRDGRVAPPDGEWLTHTGPLVPCKSGLHASETSSTRSGTRRADHLSRRAGRRREGAWQTGGQAGRSARRILWRLDAETSERVLRQFARWCALQVIGLWDAPAVVREYLETGDESKRDAARGAAWDAAGRRPGRRPDAARDAAWRRRLGAPPGTPWRRRRRRRLGRRHGSPPRPPLGRRPDRRLDRRLGRAGRRA